MIKKVTFALSHMSGSETLVPRPLSGKDLYRRRSEITSTIHLYLFKHKCRANTE